LSTFFYGDDVETDFFQSDGHVVGVIGGIRKTGGMLVGSIANNERHALFSACRSRTGRNHEQDQKDRRESVHLRPPHSLMMSSRVARTLGSTRDHQSASAGRASIGAVNLILLQLLGQECRPCEMDCSTRSRWMSLANRN
jgi:hypothetical protein